MPPVGVPPVGVPPGDGVPVTCAVLIMPVSRELAAVWPHAFHATTTMRIRWPTSVDAIRCLRCELFIRVQCLPLLPHRCQRYVNLCAPVQRPGCGAALPGQGV